MFRISASGVGLVLFVVGAVSGLPEPAVGQEMVEHSAEARFQLDLQVPEEALLEFFPPGWTPNVSTRGPATDANLRAIFIDRITINDPDGRPLGTTGSNRLVYLVAPATNPAGDNVQLVIGGLTADSGDAPGPFDNYVLATTHTMRRSSMTDGGVVIDSQDWVFTADTGEHIEMHITFERGVGNKGNPREVQFYSAEDPTFFRISREERVLEILRNVTTTPPDRVREFSFEASGGRYADLFDGTQRVLSWDNIPWITRTVFEP